MPLPGAVHIIPREVGLANDPKDRPMVLAHACDAPADVFASFQYATSQDTQARCGVPHVQVAARAGTAYGPAAGNGLRQATYVFPGLLVPVPLRDLRRAVGWLDEAERAAVAARLPDALGCGSGTCWSNATGWQTRGPVYHAGGPGRSLRGRLVSFAPQLLDQLRGETREEDVRFAVLASPHAVSAHPDAFQTVVPVVGEFEATHPDEFAVEGEMWIEDVEHGADSALVLVPQAFYVHRSALRRTACERVVSPATMAQIEQGLLARLTRASPAGEAATGPADGPA